MGRLARPEGLTDVQEQILDTVRDFTEREIIPHAQRLEHADEYPQAIVDGMRELGLFGLTIPEEYGGLGESLLTYALVVEELARGWMSVSGIVNTHFIVAYLLLRHGTDEQKAALLPRLATGLRRGEEVRTAAQSQVGSIEAMRPEDIADAISFIVTRDRRVAINEMLVRAGEQSW